MEKNVLEDYINEIVELMEMVEARFPINKKQILNIIGKKENDINVTD